MDWCQRESALIGIIHAAANSIGIFHTYQGLAAAAPHHRGSGVRHFIQPADTEILLA
jgi:hypothetical protein